MEPSFIISIEGVARIEVGLGGVRSNPSSAYSEPLYVFVTGRGLLMSLVVRAAGHLVIAREPALRCPREPEGPIDATNMTLSNSQNLGELP